MMIYFFKKWIHFKNGHLAWNVLRGGEKGREQCYSMFFLGSPGLFQSSSFALDDKSILSSPNAQTTTIIPHSLHGQEIYLKTRYGEMIYIQLKKQHDEGLEKKSPREQKINPVCFPFHPLSMMWRADCFPVSKIDRKNKPGCSYGGRGPILIEIKQKHERKGAAEELDNIEYSNVCSRS